MTPCAPIFQALCHGEGKTRRVVPLAGELAVDVPVAWTGASGHLLHERWIPPWIRDGLAALISELEAAAPPGLDRTRTAFRQRPPKKRRRRHGGGT